jgi:deazaflavin-dependent oxidoreductase (nitroreductase family)
MARPAVPTAAPPPGRLARRARIMRVVNVPMRPFLRLPFATPASRYLMLLEFTGRKTGKRYQQPVSYTRDGNVLLTPGGGRWKLNLRDGESIAVRFRGRKVQLRPEFVTDTDEVAELVAKMVATNPRAAGFMPFVEPGGEIDRGRVEAALGYGFAIIRWHFDG